jgi:hypothetical protein
MPARAVPALDIALRRNCQMHAAVFVVVSSKAWMSLNIFLFAFVCHVYSPSAAGETASPVFQMIKARKRNLIRASLPDN